MLCEPERHQRPLEQEDEPDPSQGQQPNVDDRSTIMEPTDAPPSPPALGDWAGWSTRQLTTLEGLKPAPAVHRIALAVGLPYDTELAVPRRRHTQCVWAGCTVLVALVTGLAVGVALARASTELGGDSDAVYRQALRVLCAVSVVTASLEGASFCSWMVRLRSVGIVPPSPEFPRPPRKRCMRLRNRMKQCASDGSVNPEPPAAVASNPAEAKPRKAGWRGLWGGVELARSMGRGQRRASWLALLLLLDVLLCSVLWISLGYCTAGASAESDSGSGRQALAEAELDGGVLCWVVWPSLTPPLTASHLLSDFAAEAFAAEPAQSYEKVNAGDVVVLSAARVLVVGAVLLLGSGLRMPADAPKPAGPLLRAWRTLIYGVVLKGCVKDPRLAKAAKEKARADLFEHERKRDDASGVPRWRRRHWRGLLWWCALTLFLLGVKALMLFVGGGCGEDDVHPAGSFLAERCASPSTAGLAVAGGRPFDLRGSPNAWLPVVLSGSFGLLEVGALLGLGWRLNWRPKRVLPEQDSLKRALLELIDEDDGATGVAVNDDSRAARRVSRWLLALEVSGVLEQGGPALFAWMESVLPPGHATQPVRYVIQEAAARQQRALQMRSESERMAQSGLGVEARSKALLRGETDPGGGEEKDSAMASHARLGWRGLERIWGKYLSYHVSADRYSAPWSAAEHTVLAQLAGDSSLSWKQKAVRLEELVSGAPRRSHLAVKRRWAQLERLASKAGWRCAESGTYRVAGWANDATGEWMWEYPLDTAGS